jgi:hypothetical protein
MATLEDYSSGKQPAANEQLVDQQSVEQLEAGFYPSIHITISEPS